LPPDQIYLLNQARKFISTTPKATSS